MLTTMAVVGVLEPEKVRWRALFCSNRTTSYVFWALVVTFGALTVRDLNNAFNDYLENNTQTNMMVVFNETMSFPNITFCMGKEQATLPLMERLQKSSDDVDWDEAVNKSLSGLKSAHDFLSRSWDWRLVQEAVEVVGTLFTFERELTLPRIPLNLLMLGKSSRTALKRQMVQQWLGTIASKNVTFNQFLQKTGYELIKMSLQRMKRVAHFTDKDLTTFPLITWISTSLFCFQPAAHEEFYQPIDSQGEFFNLQLRSPVAYAKHDLDCITVDFEGRASDYERFAVGKGRSRDGVFEEMCFGTDTQLYVEVLGVYKQLENENEGKRCKEYEGGTDTEYGCVLKCRLKFIRASYRLKSPRSLPFQNICGCTAMTLQDYMDDESELEQFPLCNSYEKCKLEPTQLPVNETEEECRAECHRSCTIVQYGLSRDMKAHSAQLVSLAEDGADSTAVAEPTRDPNVTAIRLHWGTFEYIQTEQDWESSWSSFMGNVGGILGLWLGLSVLGLIQGSFFIYDKCRGEYGRRKRADAEPEAERQEDGKRAAPEEGRKTSAMEGRISTNPLGSTSLAFNPFDDFVRQTVSSTRKSSAAANERGQSDLHVDPNPRAG